MIHKGIELDETAGLTRLWDMEYNGQISTFQEAGWRHADIATALGVHVTTISNKMNGRSKVTRADVWALQRLAEIYKIPSKAMKQMMDIFREPSPSPVTERETPSGVLLASRQEDPSGSQGEPE